MRRQLLIGISSLVILFFYSCLGVKTKLDQEDLSWLAPYEKGDTLIFSSSTGLLDTCYIVGKSIYYSDYKPNGFPTKYTSQVGEIIYRKRGIDDSFERGEMIIVQKDNPDSSALKAVKYCYSYFSADDLYRQINEVCTIRGITYSDLWLISKWDISWKPNEEEMVNVRPKFIYWSKSSGLVKYITYSGIVWELKEKLHRK